MTSSSVTVPASFGFSDLPALFQKADHGAVWSRRGHYFFFGLEAVLLVLAAATEVIGRQNGATIASWLPITFTGTVSIPGTTYDGKTIASTVGALIVPVLLIGLLIGVRFFRVGKGFASRWRGRRALAESIAALCWRYVMGGLQSDLPGAAGTLTPDEAFAQEWRRITARSGPLRLSPSSADEPITPPMRSLRAQGTLLDKKTLYLRDRVVNQIDYYVNRASSCRRGQSLFQSLTFVAYGSGLPLLLVNGLGIATTAAGAFTGWLGAKHYDDLADNYEGVVTELQALRQMGETLDLTSDGAEDRWANWVDQVEAVLEGEHRDWLARVQEHAAN